MRRLIAVLLVLGICLLGITSASLGPPLGRAQALPTAASCGGRTGCGLIQHIVFIVKENRSFDSMFGRFPGARGTTTFVDSDGKSHPLAHQPRRLSTDIQHNFASALTAMDGGKMDGFAQIQGALQHGVDMADSQYDRTDIPKYWSYARRFTLADGFFSSILGNSFANHLFTVAAGGGDVISNPAGPNWGCDTTQQTTVERLDVTGTAHTVKPCFDFPTETDLLDAAGIPWRYYAPDQSQGGYIWSSLDAIRHVRFGPEWSTNVVNYGQFAGDAAAGQLPGVSWLVQPAPISDHPPHNICWGENWTVAQINAVMSDPAEWAHTAIIVVWDDFGGFYDHVTPPKGPNPHIQYGPRVPALIISPYARRGFIDHHFYTFSSLLKFVQHILNLPALPGMDPKPGNLTHAFDFKQAPAPPLTLTERSTCGQPPPR
jgi:phospholipase C